MKHISQEESKGNVRYVGDAHEGALTYGRTNEARTGERSLDTGWIPRWWEGPVIKAPGGQVQDYIGQSESLSLPR